MTPGRLYGDGSPINQIMNQWDKGENAASVLSSLDIMCAQVQMQVLK